MALRILAVIIFVFLPFYSSLETAQAEDEQQQYLFGDWGGKRQALEEKGIAIESILTNDLIANTSGGVKRTAGVLGNYDLTASVDTTKSGMWKDGTIFLYGLGNYGKDPTSFVGDLQGSDNIETYDTFKLYEAWYEHSFAEGKLTLLAGLHDYNSEFDALDFAGTLINSSFGISNDIAQVGPSIFSTTALAARLKAQLSSEWYLLTAIYDGVPGDPNNPRGTRIRLDDGDGIFAAFETGLAAPESARHYKVGLGGWIHTARYEDFRGEQHSSNRGLYAIAETMLLAEEDPAQGLGVFFQSGFADDDRNQVARYFGGGLSYSGLIPTRDEDVLALGFALARNGEPFRDAQPGYESSEVAFEMTYHLKLLPYLALQPDVQYIVNPGTDAELENACVIGIRTEVNL